MASVDDREFAEANDDMHVWEHSGLRLLIRIRKGRVTLENIEPQGAERESRVSFAHANSLVEVRTVADGTEWSGNRSNQTLLGSRLRYEGHATSQDGLLHTLSITQRDPETGLEAVSVVQSWDGSRSISARTQLTNRGGHPVTVLAASSLIWEIPVDDVAAFADIEVWWARNEWLSEARWSHASLREVLPDVNRELHPVDSRSALAFSGLGSWSSGRYLPMGMIENQRSGLSYAWQVENPGPWRWEVAERLETVYVGLFGPTDFEHQWSARLYPGETFETASATLSIAAGHWNDAVAELTRARRRQRMPHPSFVAKPVVFNDYMNAIHGDPTEEKLLPLIEAAASAGAEIFCIDAGWFDDGPEFWWDAVGRYEASTSRFPRGLNAVLDRIRELGMIPGLWLEPEVVGVRSPVADELPDDAFFTRGGERVREHGRYHLDLRSSAAVDHLDAVVDRVVTHYGVGYLKLDYNINPGPGTDGAGDSVGSGLLGHGRAYIEWLTSVRNRHPELVIMNCASGGMRMDGAVQRVTHVQQMTDQQDFLSYVPIAVAAPTAVPFDQAAAWTYPDSSMSIDEIQFCMVAPMLSRMELSGQLDQLSADQRAAVTDAVAVYKSIRHLVIDADPVWPTELPEWTDEWFTLALRLPRRTLLNVWRRSGTATREVVTLSWMAGMPVTPRILYPSDAGGSVSWDPPSGRLTVELPRPRMAVLIDLSAEVTT